MENDSTEQLAITLKQALAHIQLLAQPVSGIDSDAPLHLLLGRVLTRDVIAPVNVPPHDNAAMDGYAFHSSSILSCNSGDGILELAVIGKALAGAPWRGVIADNECVQIATGAMMPMGCDTVVPSELTACTALKIRFRHQSLFAGDNRRLKGEDMMKDSAALRTGAIITPAALGLIASLGISTLPVFRRLRVAYFSTGDELLNPGEPPREGAIYDSNRFTLYGMLTKLGVDILDLGAIPDNKDALEASLHKASSSADVVITSAGVSVGVADYTKASMQKLGDVKFWRITMRPGRPMAMGTIDRKDGSKALLFGLPGNPVAVMVTFLALVRPALLQMMGAAAHAPPMLQAKSNAAIRKNVGRTEYLRGIVSTNDGGELVVRLTDNQGSGVLSSMVQANGLIVLAHELGDVAIGDVVPVMMFDGAI